MRLATAVLLLSTSAHAWLSSPRLASTLAVSPRASASPFPLSVLAETDTSSSTIATDDNVAPDTSSAASAASTTKRVTAYTQDIIHKIPFRELRREVAARQLDASGTTAQLRIRLRESITPGWAEECIVNEDGMGEDCVPEPSYVTFIDESDPYKELLRDLADKIEIGHWKSATRRLKKLTRRFGATKEIPREIYLSTLEACMLNRLQAARASEPVRKILEQMAAAGFEIPEDVADYCINNSLGQELPHSTHEGYGGIDTALAIKSALEMAGTRISMRSYNNLALALAREGSIEDALAMIRSVIVDKTETPPLSVFAEIAQAAVARPGEKQEEKILTLFAYAKAAGYELDTIASTGDGRALLASGVIAAERLDNTALGLRLLTAASRAEGVAPDRGDTLVALSSSAAQRACTLIHKRAISQAVELSNWKLAVKLLSLMLERDLRPSPWIWRNVVACCAKAEKSKKATSLLLDWVSLYEDGKADKPPISVFNTCMNACEICNEQQLTLMVLDFMKKTHKTEGNLITFNIALKRLAKLGNYLACEGIIIGMLKEGVEPSVVSYTTAIAACASSDPKQPTIAYEWMKRMRSRKVNPTVVSYNTALAACLDGKLESTVLASKLAAEMIADVERQLVETGDDEEAAQDEYTDVLPDATTKFLARRAMEQLKKNWEEGAIDKTVATKTIRKPLLKLVDFQKSEVVAKVRAKLNKQDEDKALVSTQEMAIEFSAISSTRTAEV